ncbi:hypothetical protein B0T19DRAFT_399261 [Cercophora scortea]|uniref:Uncharacterized protein n=1 Tax=Cercophora scortea TaxID=314031 RepID=A0AAE0IZ56_9PEZI|nr:hypothetical protein B0T19DRAFT_399261 [Cercophora scortea]
MHHQRRRSGHASGNSSMTDVRKAASSTDVSSKNKTSSRPGPVTRRTTPQAVQKLGKNPRDREKEWEEERWFDEERESFPQYCMICEKQFVPSDDRFLYCSDSCRMHDQNSASTPSGHYSSSHHHSTNYPHYSGPPEPRDIIPRASPSRSNSMYYCPPTPPSASHTSAISALKSLSIRPPSPPSPVGSYHPTIWPFARSAGPTSPSSSYTRPASGLFSSTYDNGTYFGTGGLSGYGTSSDRPLPSRRPGAYSRPKSIELVTPMMGR